MAASARRWRISHVNQDYRLTETMFPQLIVPAAIQDSLLLDSAKFRSFQRCPHVVYHHALTKVCRILLTGAFSVDVGDRLCWFVLGNRLLDRNNVVLLKMNSIYSPFYGQMYRTIMCWTSPNCLVLLMPEQKTMQCKRNGEEAVMKRMEIIPASECSSPALSRLK